MRAFGGAPSIAVRDELAEILGAVPPGETITYRYEDAVKLSGHSCPTIAGAYLGGVVALRRLFAGEAPIRGRVEVTVGGERDEGAAGPSSQVYSLLTGAASETGFAGLMGRERRRGLLSFDARLGEGVARFRRTDTREGVEVRYDPLPIAAPADLGRLFGLVLKDRASAAERARFGELWQARVDAILGAPDLVLHVTRLAP